MTIFVLIFFCGEVLMTNEEFRDIFKHEKSLIKKLKFFRIDQISGYPKQQAVQHLEFETLKEVVKKYDYINNDEWSSFIRQNPKLLKFSNRCLDVVPNFLQIIISCDYGCFMDIFYNKKREVLTIEKERKKCFRQVGLNQSKADENQLESEDEDEFKI